MLDVVDGNYSIAGSVIFGVGIGVEIDGQEVLLIGSDAEAALAGVERLKPPWAFTDGLDGSDIAIVARQNMRPIDPALHVEMAMRLAKVCANQFASPTDWSALETHLNKMVGIRRTPDEHRTASRDHSCA